MLVTTLAALAAAAAPLASPLGTSRTDLQRHDLSVDGWETLQARVDFPHGVTAPRHRHPGEEIIYVLKGTLQYQLDGQEPVVLKPGGVLFVPYGVVHSAKNIGDGDASELATYVVEKGKPLLELAK
jgi:quercetin dioxygenase-like cupin family protein